MTIFLMIRGAKVKKADLTHEVDRPFLYSRRLNLKRQSIDWILSRFFTKLNTKFQSLFVQVKERRRHGSLDNAYR